MISPLIDPHAKYPRPDLDSLLFEQEHYAYFAYIDALDAIPYSQQKRRELFQKWQQLYNQLPEDVRAFLLLKRIAKRYSPGMFVFDTDTGSPECIFCGWVGLPPEHEHEPDCFAVLISRFK